MIEPHQLELVIKQLAESLAETRADLKELHVAMVGTVDGSKTGLAQHLQNVMEDLGALSKEVGSGHARIDTLETKFVRYESFFGGGKAILMGSGVLVGWILEHFSSKIFK